MPNVKLADQTIGSTATLIAGDSTYPRLIKPARTIWLGATNGVTVANGEALGANQEYAIDPGETKYAICTEDTDISVIEIRYDANLDAAVTALAEGSVSAFAAFLTSTFAVSATYREIVQLTQAQYDALGTPDASTLYVIVG